MPLTVVYIVLPTYSKSMLRCWSNPAGKRRTRHQTVLHAGSLTTPVRRGILWTERGTVPAQTAPDIANLQPSRTVH